MVEGCVVQGGACICHCVVIDCPGCGVVVVDVGIRIVAECRSFVCWIGSRRYWSGRGVRFRLIFCCDVAGFYFVVGLLVIAGDRVVLIRVKVAGVLFRVFVVVVVRCGVVFDQVFVFWSIRVVCTDAFIVIVGAEG